MPTSAMLQNQGIQCAFSEAEGLVMFYHGTSSHVSVCCLCVRAVALSSSLPDVPA